MSPIQHFPPPAGVKAPPAQTADKPRRMRTGAWQSTIGVGLHGKTLGVVGLGRLGTDVARIGKAFGMEVVAYDPYLPDEAFAQAGVERVDLDELFRRGDFVSCHLPWTPETFHLIESAERDLIS